MTGEHLIKAAEDGAASCRALIERSSSCSRLDVMNSILGINGDKGWRRCERLVKTKGSGEQANDFLTYADVRSEWAEGREHGSELIAVGCQTELRSTQIVKKSFHDCDAITR